jgi:hypothetical protein
VHRSSDESLYGGHLRPRHPRSGAMIARQQANGHALFRDAVACQSSGKERG